MEFYGIKNITEKDLNFSYDKYYKELALNLKKVTDKKLQDDLRKKEQETFSNSNKIQIDLEKLKSDFIDLILDENSIKYLWIIYSKYNNNENYIDKISTILKRENTIIRGGTNTYKMNGWMAHTLYVYQIANYNIPKNIEITNFNGSKESKEQLNELHNIYETLSFESRFLLKVFCLIHDIGVIEDITYHDVLGSKYVEKVLEEIGLTQNKLDENKIKISLENLIKTLQILISYHTLISALSTEANDEFVEQSFRNLIENIPEIANIKKQIPEVLFVMGYSDITGVDESIMDDSKYQRTKDCYIFFKEIINGEKHNRNKEKVAIERICDTAGKIKFEVLKNKLDDILKSYNIDKNEFIENMYNLRLMRYVSPLMKSLNDINLTIKVYAELLNLISYIEGKEKLKVYTIYFMPKAHESKFVEEIKNNNFFVAIDKMKSENIKFAEIGKIQIEINSEKETVFISINENN